MRWGRDRPRNIRKLLLTALVSTLVLSVLLPWLLEDKIIRHDGGGDGDGLLDCGAGGGRSRTARVPRHEKPLSATGGMVAAHLGLAVTITGIAFSQNYSVGA
ncbi:cytochrome c-type biogenesis protein F2 [Salmonella enterica subsp. enterica]|nr:cytochrome c-type biogenesis protein F2 [Salmonella enterica subsp. enterica]